MSFNFQLTLPPTNPWRPINPGNAWGFCLTAPAGTELGSPYSYGTVCLAASSHIKELYTPKGFIIHVTSLRQAFAHCGRFSTAASRRSMARVAVPFLGVALSRPLPVIDLVGRYPANYLIGRRPFLNRIAALPLRDYGELPRLSTSYAPLWGWYLRVTKPFAGCIAAPVTCMPVSTLPAFTLS